MSTSNDNPINGQQVSSDEDQEDLFVSTVESQSDSKPKSATEMMSTINLDDEEAPAAKTVESEEVESPEKPASIESASIPEEKPQINSPPPLFPSGDQLLPKPVDLPPMMSSSAQQPPVAKPPASQITIKVSDPHKVGDGIGSYMVYAINTNTSLSYFRRNSMSVNRRFSDFLGLHEKLLEKHSHLGRIIPPPPSKNAVGTAKIKMSKDEQTSSEFLEKRRAALERYLQRNADHPIICADPDFREFLELDTELPRSTSTSALSGAGVKRLFSFVGDTVNKITFRMDELDPWFESKQAQLDSLETQFRKLYASVESLIHHRKELTSATGQLAKSTAILSNCEEHNSLSCALSQLAATHEKIEKVYERQTNNDFQHLAELFKDYIALVGSVKEAFHERVKCFQNLANTEHTLAKKREQKAKFELTLKNDRVPAVEEEIRELETKLANAKDSFDNISSNIKTEFERFELNRVRDFKKNFLNYMQSLLEEQESLVECWEAFLPEARSIVV